MTNADRDAQLEALAGQVAEQQRLLEKLVMSNCKLIEQFCDARLVMQALLRSHPDPARARADLQGLLDSWFDIRTELGHLNDQLGHRFAWYFSQLSENRNH